MRLTHKYKKADRKFVRIDDFVLAVNDVWKTDVKSSDPKNHKYFSDVYLDIEKNYSVGKYLLYCPDEIVIFEKFKRCDVVGGGYPYVEGMTREPEYVTEHDYENQPV